MSSGLWQDIKNHPLALVIAVLAHGLLIVLLSINLSSSEVHAPKRNPQSTIKAVVVDAKTVEQEIARLKRAEQKKQQQQLAEQKKLKREQERVKKQLAAEKKKLAELKKKKAAEKKRQAQLKKQAELKKKREAERKKKLAAEKKRQQELKKKREAERKRKLAEEAERKRKEAEARRKKAEQELQRKLAEEERLEREAREAAARQKMLDSLRAQYVRQIRQKVERNWLRPAGMASAGECEVLVTQNRLGDVLDVRLTSCQNDAAYRRSIERAVRKAAPLPSPPDPAVFEKTIHFVFRPPS